MFAVNMPFSVFLLDMEAIISSNTLIMVILSDNANICTGKLKFYAGNILLISVFMQLCHNTIIILSIVLIIFYYKKDH